MGFKFQPGDYFGELALLHNEPRAATVQALTKLKVCSVERATFKRVLGPLEQVLERNVSRYSKYLR